ncbi:MAG: GDP-mannose 4,6-dehydratase [Candidatus Cloacimonetes bacterium]|nr:GDP-mannose 4,6-dehydratase [Candidatus Cloacimonadota bacterium]
MKILLTGGAGFIGSHVAEKYLELGHEVVIIDNLSTGNMRNIPAAARFYEMDIRSPKLVAVMNKERPQIVNHHAAQISVPYSVSEPQFDVDVNVTGFINLLQSCVKTDVKKVIFISSGGAVYGEAEEYPTSERYSPQPLSPYAINKYVSEKYLYYYHHQFGLPYTILRYANVYGPRQIPHGEAGVVAIFITNFIDARQSVLYAYQEEPEGMIRDYVYVKDVVTANVLVLDRGEMEIYNVGTGIETSTGSLYQIIMALMHQDIAPIRKPARPGDLRKSCLDITKIKGELNWQPGYDLTSGIRETIGFFSQ